MDTSHRVSELPRGAAVAAADPDAIVGVGQVIARSARQVPWHASRSRPWAADPAWPVRPNAGDAALLAQEEAAHRLANLLQLTVYNLERAARTVDGAAKQALGAAIDQITAASRLHQLLDVPGTEEMLAGSYLRMLGDTLNQLLLAPAGHLLVVDVQPAANLVLPVPLLRLLGQLVVEVVVNASKHAYPNTRDGRILLTLANAMSWLCCSIVDDGIGNLTQLGRPGSRGMTLIDGLAHQMGGRCRWVFGNQGTEFQVTWPVMPETGA